MAVIMAKTERLQIRISPDMKSELQKLAKADGRTVSNYIEQLIKNAIEQKK
jgi:predicted DNA-binding protein